MKRDYKIELLKIYANRINFQEQVAKHSMKFIKNSKLKLNKKFNKLPCFRIHQQFFGK